jgi:hypothetical protein
MIGNRVICAIALAAASQPSVPLHSQLLRRSTEPGAWWPRPRKAIAETSNSASQ